MDQGIKVSERKSTFQLMREMIKKNPPTKLELAQAIVGNSLNKSYTIEAAKKTVPVRLNNLRKQAVKNGFSITCRLHDDGKYRYHFEKVAK